MAIIHRFQLVTHNCHKQSIYTYGRDCKQHRKYTRCYFIKSKDVKSK